MGQSSEKFLWLMDEFVVQLLSLISFSSSTGGMNSGVRGKICRWLENVVPEWGATLLTEEVCGKVDPLTELLPSRRRGFRFALHERMKLVLWL